jgi:integrase/recombinase XerD
MQCSKKKMSVYLPARLVTGYRWYILYYQTNPDTGNRERFRDTCDLNRIKNLRDRKKRAQELISEINSKLHYGYPFVKIASELMETPICEAIDIACALKCQSDRFDTRKTYKTGRNIFKLFLEQKGMLKLPVSKFSISNAIQFMDYLVSERKVANKTYNNYIILLHSMMADLLKRKYIDVNPFTGIAKKKATQKLRISIDEKNKAILIHYIRQNDKVLFLGILLLYFTFIRPAEMRRLKIKDIDLKRRMIAMDGEQTKNRRIAIKTIPDAMIDLLTECMDALKDYPGNYLIFGQNLKPHPTKSAGRNTLNNKHKKIMRSLFEKGIIDDITGISFYSWKDTGVQNYLDMQINMYELMRQLGHADLETTQIYAEKRAMINHSIKSNAPSIM